MKIILPNEIWSYIYSFDPTYHRIILHKIHNELLENCARRYIEDLPRHLDKLIAYEITYHKSIHPLYNNVQYWKNRGWCSVKCGAINWPHMCDFCLTCNADPDYCCCNCTHNN